VTDRGNYPLDGSTAACYPYGMSKSNRNDPKRSTASESRYSVFEFMAEFPDDAACLNWLFHKRWPEGVFCPKCERVTKHHRERSRPSYSCQFCGHRVHPMKGTIFEDSATSLHLWFHAMYLMASTRCGISAKQLEREIGVTYKTAWRMFTKIRSLLGQDDEPLSGHVEMDETFVGGKPRLADRERRPDGSFKRGRTEHSKKKAMVFGAVERSGRIRAEVLPERAGAADRAKAFVLPSSVVYTDEWVGYDEAGQGFAEHHRIRHAERVYVSGDVHTQTIEGFWALLKNGIRGVYHSVSSETLQTYVDEYVFRYNNREAIGRGMFGAFLDRLLSAAAPVS
jgi:transposase